MEREILFKAKASSGMGWVDGSLILLNDRTLILPNYAEFNHNANLKNGGYGEINQKGELGLIEVDPETVCQFTGLTGKNGTKIFEGDQLYVCAGYMSTVEFKDGMFVSVYEHPEDPETIPLSDTIGDDTEVIGNIHDTTQQ